MCQFGKKFTTVYTHECMYITYVFRLHYTNVYYNRQLVIFIEVNLITYTRYLQTIQSDNFLFFDLDIVFFQPILACLDNVVCVSKLINNSIQTPHLTRQNKSCHQTNHNFI